MKFSGLTPKLTVTVVIALLGTVPALAQADDAEAAQIIASVLSGLNHFPSDSDKAALMEIAEDSSTSAAYRTVARAVHNIQHSAADADKAMLNDIVASNSAPAHARALAEIVLGISHVPSDDAKARLAAMM